MHVVNFFCFDNSSNSISIVKKCRMFDKTYINICHLHYTLEIHDIFFIHYHHLIIMMITVPLLTLLVLSIHLTLLYSCEAQIIIKRLVDFKRTSSFAYESSYVKRLKNIQLSLFNRISSVKSFNFYEKFRALIDVDIFFF